MVVTAKTLDQLWNPQRTPPSFYPSFLSDPPGTAGRGSPSLGRCRRPAGWPSCPGCFSGAEPGPEAAWWSACLRCCTAQTDTGAAGPPSSAGHPGSCPGVAPQLAGFPRTRAHLLLAPGTKKRGAEFIGNCPKWWLLVITNIFFSLFNSL